MLAKSYVVSTTTMWLSFLNLSLTDDYIITPDVPDIESDDYRKLVLKIVFASQMFGHQ